MNTEKQDSKTETLCGKDSVRESDIDLMFPLEDENKATDTRPLYRIQFYNARQRDRREGAKRLLARINHSI
jgi:hypothetical protein